MNKHIAKYDPNVHTKENWYGWQLLNTKLHDFHLNLHTGKMIVTYDNGYCFTIDEEDVKKLFEQLKIHFENKPTEDYTRILKSYLDKPNYVGPKIRRDGNVIVVEEEAHLVYDLPEVKPQPEKTANDERSIEEICKDIVKHLWDTSVLGFNVMDDSKNEIKISEGEYELKTRQEWYKLQEWLNI